ncbi:hypothetical protein B296_00040023 [Ensete ventricosum]|uniref:Uncharacterized protein n=1 Tax=Ensete ventricosum TaxID=4639 RepID=A0A426X4B4_ENSVE|nr:hypothetical protein B296_00040023 [Ensete ventricosum]
MSIVTVEMAVVSAVSFLGSSPHLEEDLSPSGVEQNVGEPRNGLLSPLHPLPWEPKRWAPKGLSPRALLILTILCHQSLGGDILVGPL